MIEAFLLDLGNVLYTFDFTKAVSFIKNKAHRISLTALFSLKKTLKKYEIGEISSIEFFNIIKKETGFNGTYEEFRLGFSDIFEINPETIPIVRKLIKKYRVYILSNTSEMHIEHIMNKFSLINEIHGHVYSFEVGTSKPDPEIFNSAIKKLHLDPNSTLFVDDLKENIEAAGKLGFITLHYPVKDGKPQINFQEELKKFKVHIV
jgi:glucose-1-phosphatase